MTLSNLIVRCACVSLPFAIVLENYMNCTSPIPPTTEISLEAHLRLINLISIIEQSIQARRGEYAFFNLAAKWSGCLTSCPGHFNPRKETRYPLYRRLSWAPRPVWTYREDLVPHRGSIPGQFSPLRVAIPTTISRPTSVTHFNNNSYLYFIYIYRV